MNINYTLPELAVFLLLYAFMGWVAETCCIAAQQRQYVNRGFLNLPLAMPYGIAGVLLLLGLPHLDNMALQYLLCLIVFRMVRSLSNQFIHSVSGQPRLAEEYTRSLPPLLRHGLLTATAAILLTVYLVVHPFLLGLVRLLPATAVTVIGAVGWAAVVLDFCSVLYALRTKHLSAGGELFKSHTEQLNLNLALSIRDRLNRAYPGILTPDPSDDGDHTFARGICLDKLIWVFLITSFLGALIEMAYCRLYGGAWMNRSSLLYGSFSVVWGLGAVVLTVVLQNMVGKPDRYVFFAGFFIGGAYEYLCSVLSELLFGTVFWDYSHMPLNIGGRTNVLYCVFWGILAVVWLNILYPRLSGLIERIPAVQGKIVTWALLLMMVCDCVLTAGAMVRYTVRQTNPEPTGFIEKYLDAQYNDAWMEHRWPNMKLT